MVENTDDTLEKLTFAANKIYESYATGEHRITSPYALEGLNLHYQIGGLLRAPHNASLGQDRKDALGAVLYERFKQDEKWGKQDHQFPVWLAILMEEIGEASKEALAAHFNGPGSYPNFRTELVQSAAVLLAMIECGDRNNWWDPK